MGSKQETEIKKKNDICEKLDKLLWKLDEEDLQEIESLIELLSEQVKTFTVKNIEPAYIIPVQENISQAHYNDNSGWPKIIGLYSITPKGCDPRICYKVQYPSGFMDYINEAFLKDGTFKIISESEYIALKLANEI